MTVLARRDGRGEVLPTGQVVLFNVVRITLIPADHAVVAGLDELIISPHLIVSC